MLELSLYILGNKNHMINYLIFFFCGDGNKSSAHIYGPETIIHSITSTSAAGSTASTNTTNVSVISPGK